MQRFFKLIIKCTRIIDCRLTSVFPINLEPFHILLVLLFELLTGKCFLGKASLTFCQIHTMMSTYTHKTLHRFK